MSSNICFCPEPIAAVRQNITNILYLGITYTLAKKYVHDNQGANLNILRNKKNTIQYTNKKISFN